MVNDLYRKMGPFFLKNRIIELAFQFLVSATIGVIYALMIVNETINEWGLMHRIHLPNFSLLPL